MSARISFVVGIGNPLRMDDGFGPAVIDALEASGVPGGVTLLRVHQLTPELADDIRQVSRVLFVDVRLPRDDSDVGLLLRRVEPTPARPGAFSHGFEPGALLEFTQRVYGGTPDAWELSAAATDFSLQVGLSAACEALVEEAAVRALAWATATDAG